MGLAKTCIPNHYALEYLCYYYLLYSVLWYPFVDPRRLTHDDKLFILYSLATFACLAAPYYCSWQSCMSWGQRC